MSEVGMLRGLTWRDVASSMAGLAVVVVLIGFVLPSLLDTSWDEIGAQLARTTWTQALLMALLLLAGLVSYTWVLTGALPGLRNFQALRANAVSSLMSNVMPVGAAVGLALMVFMFRSWGHPRRAISASLLVAGLWNVMARISLPVIGFLVLVAGPVDAPAIVVQGAFVAGAAGIAVIVLASLSLFSDTVARGIVKALEALARLVRRRGTRARQLEQLVDDQRERVASIVRRRWLPMTLGMTGQFALLFGMYWVAARTVGVDIPLAALIAAYTFRQVLTLVAFTPGGLGITEVGTAGLLVVLGASAGAASATALLYAIFAHVVVIPFGIAFLATWWYGPRRKALTPTGSEPQESSRES